MLKNLVAKSRCYGHLYDEDDPNCQRCEAWFRCERETGKNETDCGGEDAEQVPHGGSSSL